MKESTLIIFGILIGLLTMVSCAEYIDIEPGVFNKKIIIDATLTNEYQKQLIKISHTREINTTEFQFISNASVYIEFKDSVIWFIENDTLPGYYYSEIEFAGVPGNTYTLTVTDVDVNEDSLIEGYTAESTMGNALTIDSVGYEYIDKWEAVALKCYAWDPPEQNFYNFRAWVNDRLTTDTIYEYSATDDLFFNGNYTNGIPCQYFQDEYPDEFIEKGDTLTLGIENIDEAYFTYISSAINEYYGYNPLFGGMPANIESNISNGALGIFRVYTIAKSSVVVTEDIIRK